MTLNAGKAAKALRGLFNSRVCVREFVECNGLVILAKILQDLMNGKKINLHEHSTHRTIIEHCSGMYREIARYHPCNILLNGYKSYSNYCCLGDVVKSGGLRNCKVLLTFGDLTIRITASGTLAILSQDIEISKVCGQL